MKFEKVKLCSACQADKQVANTHPTKAYMSTRLLELLHMNIFGPTTYKSLGGNLYYLVLSNSFPLSLLIFAGIKHEVSATYTPQQNGVVERKN